MGYRITVGVATGLGFGLGFGGFEDSESPMFRVFVQAHQDLIEKFGTYNRELLKKKWKQEYGGTVITESFKGYEKWVGIEFDNKEDYFLFLLKTVR